MSIDQLKNSTAEAAITQAREWWGLFSPAVVAADVPAISDLFLDDSFWRDRLALTSDKRTIHGKENITTFLQARLNITSLVLSEEPSKAPTLVDTIPGQSLMRVCFEFDNTFGSDLGVAHLVQPNKETNVWKVYTMFTCLTALKGIAEAIGANRPLFATTAKGSWRVKRKRQIEFIDQSPDVIIIGGGHSGLNTAAHLKQLGVSALIVEKTARIGDVWRNRYDTLTLLDTASYQQLAYMPFPSTWPVHAPADKVADFLEGYVHALDLNVWTASQVERATWDEETKSWNVNILRGVEGERRQFVVKHLVFATGNGFAKMPSLPGQELFKGKVLHSSKFKSATDYPKNTKALVVGMGNSGHDMAQTFSDNGIDVTMFQRSSTYIISQMAFKAGLTAYTENCDVDFLDRRGEALPYAVTKRMMQEAVVPYFAQTLDKALLDGLTRAGFNLNTEGHGGIFELLPTRGGSYCIDVGCSQLIVDGKVKVKTGTALASFTEDGVKFEDGSFLQADVVVFATGYGNIADTVAPICGAEVQAKLRQLWGLDEEGELQGVWTDSGHEGLWFGFGNFSRSRLHSKILALRIKGLLDGVLPPSF